MAVCRECWPWTMPLTLNAQRLVNGGTIAMRFEQWLAYYFHVAIHQVPADWSGEIERMAVELRIADEKKTLAH